jgi:hypothetical protein
VVVRGAVRCRRRSVGHYGRLHPLRGDVSCGVRESLILAQDERWRRALRMQVGRASHPGRDRGGRVRNTYVTCPVVGDNPSKGGLIPHVVRKLRLAE